ncbi:MAG: hypothetical protein HZA07_01430 [Nitrospirae bacterium]|nr:hypothetical protein [Nitrospirota bacterium]
MLKYNGGDKVRKGTYWNFATGERIDVTHEGVLPGERKAIYFRLPATGILVLGPILGLIYAAFLPFIGIAMVARLIGEKVLGGLFGLAGRTVSFGWRPSEAYLAGKKKKGKAEKKEEAGEEKHK